MLPEWGVERVGIVGCFILRVLSVCLECGTDFVIASAIFEAILVIRSRVWVFGGAEVVRGRWCVHTLAKFFEVGWETLLGHHKAIHGVTYLL